MAKTNFTSVEEYIQTRPPEAQATLRRVRRVIRNALPGAAEVISYQIPTYKLNGQYVIYFAGWKAHYSLYPVSDRVVSSFKKDIAPYRVSKATLRFSLAEPVPVRLIERVVRALAKAAVARAKAKTKGS